RRHHLVAVARGDPGVCRRRSRDCRRRRRGGGPLDHVRPARPALRTRGRRRASVCGTMTELLYLEDGYLREFDASVVAGGAQAIALDRTAFFPGGGGQPPDAGQLRWPGGETRV